MRLADSWGVSLSRLNSQLPAAELKYWREFYRQKHEQEGQWRIELMLAQLCFLVSRAHFKSDKTVKDFLIQSESEQPEAVDITPNELIAWAISHNTQYENNR